MSDSSRVSLAKKNLEEVTFEQVSGEGKDQDSETAVWRWSGGTLTRGEIQRKEKLAVFERV